MALMSAGAQAWAKGLETWGKMLGGVTAAPAADEKERKDRRFAAPEWRENPIFDTIRQTYLRVSDQLLGTVDEIEGVDPATREKLRFATRSFVDAMSPSNFALTNPQVLKRTLETRGENLLKGLANMLKDIASGQLTQTKPGVFEVGRNLATTPGKVVKQTPLYQLIQYTPTTDEVLKTPVVIFPPWINRFYILDLTPEKSFVKWCVDNGIIAVHGQLEVGRREHRRRDARRLCARRARSTRSTRSATCSASRACTRSAIASRGRRWRRRSPTSRPRGEAGQGQVGDLLHRAGRFQPRPATSSCSPAPRRWGCSTQLTKEKGYLDGRYMAATFNLLRGRDLIWSYVVNNYLLGEEPRAVRPAPLEQRHDQPARRLAPRLSRDALQGEQAGREGRDQRRRNADRHRCGEDADLRPGRARGPYRAAAERVEDHGPFRRAEAVRARRLGPYRRRGEPAGGAEIPILGQRPAVRRRSTRSSRARRSTRAAGGPTGSNGSRSRIRRR